MLEDHLLVFEHFLLCTGQLGSHIPKTGCQYQWFRIEEEDDDQIVVIDDDRGNFWRQPKKDGLAFEVNWRLIYRMLCEDLGIEFSYRRVEGLKLVHRIGIDRPAMGVELPVYHYRGSLCVELAKLMVMTEGPFVLLHWGGDEIDEQSAAMLRNRNCLALPMLHSVAMNDRGVAILIESAKRRLDDLRFHLAPAEKPSATENVFDYLNGTSWSQVHFKFVDQHTVRISADSKSRTFHYSQLSMANSRNAEPTKQWLALKAYAESNGFINWKSRGASANLKKQTQELNRKLKSTLQIAGIPIEYDSDDGGYRTIFTVEDI